MAMRSSSSLTLAAMSPPTFRSEPLPGLIASLVSVEAGDDSVEQAGALYLR